MSHRLAPSPAISPLSLVLPPYASLPAAPGDAAAMDVDGSDTDKDALEKMVCCCTLAFRALATSLPPSSPSPNANTSHALLRSTMLPARAPHSDSPSSLLHVRDAQMTAVEDAAESTGLSPDDLLTMGEVICDSNLGESLEL